MPFEIKITAMGSKYTFRFRNKDYTAETYFSYDEEPCYIFVTLSDASLIWEFGEDITIATDCHDLISRNDDYPELKELRKAVFEAVKNGDEFRKVKRIYLSTFNRIGLQKNGFQVVN